MPVADSLNQHLHQLPALYRLEGTVTEVALASYELPASILGAGLSMTSSMVPLLEATLYVNGLQVPCQPGDWVVCQPSSAAGSEVAVPSAVVAQVVAMRLSNSARHDLPVASPAMAGGPLTPLTQVRLLIQLGRIGLGPIVAQGVESAHLQALFEIPPDPAFSNVPQAIPQHSDERHAPSAAPGPIFATHLPDAVPPPSLALPEGSPPVTGGESMPEDVQAAMAQIRQVMGAHALPPELDPNPMAPPPVASTQVSSPSGVSDWQFHFDLDPSEPAEDPGGGPTLASAQPEASPGSRSIKEPDPAPPIPVDLSAPLPVNLSAGASLPTVVSGPEPLSNASSAAPMPTAPPDHGAYRVGQSVRHGQYGVGVIQNVIPVDDSVVLSIQFEAVGKRLLDPKYTQLAPV
jgi:hypothetical protein